VNPYVKKFEVFGGNRFNENDPFTTGAAILE